MPDVNGFQRKQQQKQHKVYGECLHPPVDDDDGEV